MRRIVNTFSACSCPDWSIDRTNSNTFTLSNHNACHRTSCIVYAVGVHSRWQPNPRSIARCVGTSTLRVWWLCACAAADHPSKHIVRRNELIRLAEPIPNYVTIWLIGECQQIRIRWGVWSTWICIHHDMNYVHTNRHNEAHKFTATADWRHVAYDRTMRVCDGVGACWDDMEQPAGQLSSTPIVIVDKSI